MFDIINNFILEEYNNFLLLKEFFKKNAFLYQYIYSSFFPKYFCRVDDYGVNNKIAFDVAYAGHQNQKRNLRFVQLFVKHEQTETDEVGEVVEFPPPLPSPSCSPSKQTTQKTKKKKKKKN